METKPIQIIHSTVSELINHNPPLVSHDTLLGSCRLGSLVGRFVFKTRTGARLLPAAAIFFLSSILAPLSAAGATIVWEPASLIGGDTDVAINGTLSYAYSGGNAGATVNGETFAAGNSGTAWGANVTLTGFGNTYSAFGTGASNNWSALTTQYQTVLQGGAYGGASAGTVTLNNLTAGHSYSIQIWVNDSRPGITGRSETTGGTGNAVTLAYNNLNTGGGVGKYAIGYFVADATTQTFTLTPSSSGSVQLNAISVRDNGSYTKTWLGGSSTSWGAAANWNPAVVPLFPSDSVLFNNSSTANLGTMLDTSYNIATLTLNNEPSAVSIGSDGNILTIGSGIYLLGASQSLTIDDALVLGTSQIWTATNSGSTLTVNSSVSGSAALTITGAGSVTLGSAAIYTGNTTISNGNLILNASGSLASPNIIVSTGSKLNNAGSVASTSINVAAGGTLALSGTGSFSAASPNPTIFMAGGAIFDASAASGPAFAGTVTNTSTGVVLNGSIDYSSATISMLYDGVHAPFIVTNGTLNLGGSTVINVNNTSAVLPVGAYTIITAAQTGTHGAVGGTLPSVNLTGNGAVGAASLQLDGNNDLQLVVAAPDEWTGTSDNSWANAGNWTPANVPNPLDWILFDTLSTSHLNTVLNQDFVPTGLSIVNPAGPVTIGGGNNLEIGAGGINMQSASQDLTITAPLNIPSPAQWNIAANRNLNINGGATGGSGPTIVGPGSVNLNSPVTFQGTTTVASGSTLKMTTANVLSSVPSSALAINGLLDLNGMSETIDALNGTGIVDNTGGGSVTLTLGAGGDGGTFNGIIQNTGGSLSLVLTNGSETLNGVNGVNTYSGGTTISNALIRPGYAGNNSYVLGTGPVTIQAGANLYAVTGPGYSTVTMTNAVILDGGTLHIGGSGAHQWAWSGPLTVATNSTIFSDGGTGYHDNNSGYTGPAIGISGPVTMGTNTLQTGGNGSGIYIGGSISGTGDIVAGGAGFNGGASSYVSILWLAGSNSFSGTIRAAGGKVWISSQYCAQNATLDLSNPADTGAFTFYANPAIIGGLTGVNNLNMNATVSIGNNNASTTYSGAITNNGSLIKIGTGTLTLGGANTYTGSTTVNGGTLALGGGTGSILSTNITVAGGATLDVSGAASTFTVGSGSTLTNSSVGARLAGANNCSGGTLSLVVNGSATPSITQSNGNMTVSASTVVTVNNVGAPLATGTYKLVAATTTGNIGKVVGALPTPLTLTGNGAVGAASLQLDGSGNLNLVVGTAQAWTGASSTSWNTGGNWVTGLIPGAGSNAVFNASSIANLATVLNANFNLAQLTLVNPTGPVSIAPGGAFALTLTNGINMAFASQPLTITAPVALGAAQTWTVTNTVPNALTVSNLSGSAAVTFAGGGTVVLNGTNTTSGSKIIRDGTTLKFAGPSSIALPTSGTIYVLNNAGAAGTGTIDMGGLTQTSPAYLSFPYSTTTTLTNGTITDNAAPTGVPNGAEDYNFMGTINLAPNANYISNRRFILGLSFNNFTTTINSINGSTNGSLTWGGDNNGSENYVGVTANDATTLNINGGTVNFNNATFGTGNGYLNVGANSIGAKGTINLNGANLNVGTWLKLGGHYNTVTGNTSTNTLTITNGVVTVGGGSDSANNGVLFMNGGNGDATANSGLSTLTLNNAGMLTVAQIQAGNQGTKTINLNGGTIVARPGATNNFLSAATALTVNIQNGGATINSGTNSITVAAALTANGTGGLTKTGTGGLTLTGANTYTGTTTVNAGSLLVNNASGSGTGTGAVNINSGGTLGGTGTITGLVANNAGGILSPGAGGSGTLTVNGNLTLASGSTNTFAVKGSTPANTSVALGAAVTYGGVLNIVPSGTFTAGQTFTLFSGAGATNTGNFASIAGTPGAGKTFSFTNGVLSVLGTGPSGPATLTNSVTGSVLSLSWPAGLGWRLQMQTNSLSVGLSTNWSYITDGTLSSTNITLDSTKPTVFFRLTYP